MTEPYSTPRRYTERAAKQAFRRADQRLRKWALNWDLQSGAVLLGPTKSGKSLAAACAADRARMVHPDAEMWARWVRADELSRLLAGRGGHEDIETLKRSRLLVVDELGYERFPELVLEVLGARHDWGRPTLVTSGLKLSELLARYGDATARRVVEIGKGTVVDCWGAP